MTTTEPTLTLLALLDRAVTLLDGYGSITTNGEGIDIAAHLRLAASRLREETAALAKKMYDAQHGGDERGETMAWFAREVLARIVNGPLPTHPDEAGR